MTTKYVTMMFVLIFLRNAGEAQVRDFVCNRDESSMEYHLVHPLHKVEATSHAVEYALQADPATHQIARVNGHVDVTTFDSGNSNRDSHAMEVIDAISFPEAKFTSTSIASRGDSIVVNGTLTFHGITKDIVALAKPQWGEHRLSVQGAFAVSLTEFGIDRPSLLMIPVEDRLSFMFTAVFAWN